MLLLELFCNKYSSRYGYHPFLVAPSAIKAPIGLFTPRELSGSDVKSTIKDYVQCAVNARFAGYDGVEVMGSEGYLINQVYDEDADGSYNTIPLVHCSRNEQKK
jgi:2,4-dienoyl-CoA reductase-like NADH-dependent reductase (Old Yellow Enzyme family)